MAIAKRGEPERYFREVVLAYDGDECLTWPYGRAGTGYASVHIGGRTGNVHRLVCIEVNGSPPTPKHEAAHSCGKGHEGCVAPRHLTWKTSAQNKADCLAHGTRVRGSRSLHAKLSEDDVCVIRELAEFMPQRALARHYGVTHNAIRQVVTGRSWASV